jgi:hypothetical protein
MLRFIANLLMDRARVIHVIVRILYGAVLLLFMSMFRSRWLACAVAIHVYGSK